MLLAWLAKVVFPVRYNFFTRTIGKKKKSNWTYLLDWFLLNSGPFLRQQMGLWEYLPTLFLARFCAAEIPAKAGLIPVFILITEWFIIVSVCVYACLSYYPKCFKIRSISVVFWVVIKQQACVEHQLCGSDPRLSALQAFLTTWRGLGGRHHQYPILQRRKHGNMRPNSETPRGGDQGCRLRMAAETGGYRAGRREELREDCDGEQVLDHRLPRRSLIHFPHFCHR